MKGCLIAVGVLLALPAGLCVLSTIGPILASLGRVILGLVAFAVVAAIGFFLVRSMVRDFAETDGNFDARMSVLFFVKLLSFVAMSILTIIVLVTLTR